MNTISITIPEEVIRPALPVSETIQLGALTEQISVIQPAEQVTTQLVTEQISVVQPAEQVTPQLVTEQITVPPFDDTPVWPKVEVKAGILPFVTLSAINNLAVLDCAQSLAFQIHCANVPAMNVLTIVLANWPRNRITEVWLLLTGVLAPGIGVNWPGTAGQALPVKPGGNNEYLLRSWDGDNIFKVNTGFYYA